MEEFIQKNYEKIYCKVMELFPDVVHSDFYLEDIDAEEFVENYMREELELWKKEHSKDYTN